MCELSLSPGAQFVNEIQDDGKTKSGMFALQLLL